jgi:hypothetical protein
MTSHRSSIPILLVLMLGSAPAVAGAQDSLAFEYAVKFVCGTPETRAVAPGVYFTAINVHNPGADSVTWRKKVASTLPREQPGPISLFSANTLTPDQALEIDCSDIFRHARLVRFAKGFVVIQSPDPLDVVAVYTAAGSTRQVETLALERVPARRLGGAGCPDLVVDSILPPVWDAPNHRSVITAMIRNVGARGRGVAGAGRGSVHHGLGRGCIQRHRPDSAIGSRGHGNGGLLPALLGVQPRRVARGDGRLQADGDGVPRGQQHKTYSAVG